MPFRSPYLAFPALPVELICLRDETLVVIEAAFAFAFVELICFRDETLVVVEALLRHPGLHVIHPCVVQHRHLFLRQRTLEVKVQELRNGVILLADFRSRAEQTLETSSLGEHTLGVLCLESVRLESIRGSYQYGYGFKRLQLF